MRCPRCLGFAPEGAERCPSCGYPVSEAVDLAAPAGAGLPGARNPTAPRRMSDSEAPGTLTGLYPWQEGPADVRGGAFQRLVSWGMAHAGWLAGGAAAGLFVVWLGMRSGGRALALVASLLCAWAAWREGRRRGTAATALLVLAAAGWMALFVAVQTQAPITRGAATVPTGPGAASPGRAGASGLWNGVPATLTAVPNAPVESYADAELVGQIHDFQTSARPQSCLDGEAINVWLAPREFPGLYVVHDGAQGAQCAYGTWTFPAPRP